MKGLFSVVKFVFLYSIHVAKTVSSLELLHHPTTLHFTRRNWRTEIYYKSVIIEDVFFKFHSVCDVIISRLSHVVDQSPDTLFVPCLTGQIWLALLIFLFHFLPSYIINHFNYFIFSFSSCPNRLRILIVLDKI